MNPNADRPFIKAWVGTLIGATGGALLGGPLGAITGAGIGQAWDRGWLWPGSIGGLPTELRVLFELLGHLAKADGRVSEREVAFVERLMERFKLRDKPRQIAVAAFQHGRDEGFNLDQAIAGLDSSGLRGTAEAVQMLDLLTRLAEADGPLVPAEKGALAAIAKRLGISAARAAPNSQTIDITWTTTSARAELGIASSASADEVRASYKRLMSRYHPDKLAAQALSDDQRSAADDRLRRIRSAYEFLRSRA